ncbi:MAG: hypothetical protein Q8O67_11925 [Deltaproteobacteria bacterium]|nr:hypothetical protein [Deltaproteobacteria bacterium]
MSLRLLVVALLIAGTGCSTIIKPTRPSQPFASDGLASLPGVRFDGEEVQIREPGMPLSPSRSWQREVANHTATSLNTLLTTDENAPSARTVVSFDLSGPSVIQIGTWKEMTISLTSTLPDGSVVRSAPLTANIDDPIEYAAVTSLGVGGTILDVTAGISSIFFVFSPSLLTGAIFIGALLGGLTLNLAQSGSQYLVAGSEEKRWSDLYARALVQHAADVRAGIGKGPPPSTTKTPLGPLTPSRDPSDPPPLLDVPPK